MKKDKQRKIVSAIIMSFNEENDIERCLTSVSEWAEIFVVDSGSTDRTIEIAKQYGAKVVSHEFKNYSEQFNWSLSNLPLKTDWVLRLDCDEIITESLSQEIIQVLSCANSEIDGFYLKRQVLFMGRTLRFGGVSSVRQLKLFRNEKGYCEKRWMDEHIKVSGKTAIMKNYWVHNDTKSMDRWLGKHFGYATREAIDLLSIRYDLYENVSIKTGLLCSSEGRKRYIKEKIYANLPLFLRPLLYFIYIYILRLGFVDGIQGLIFCFFQGFWYRFLVDVKIFEILRQTKGEKNKMVDYIYKTYNINLL